MPVRLPASTLARYERFSLFNSPYPAHDDGRAIDLYPGDGSAPSPVAGTVRDVREVAVADRAHAADTDFLLLVDVDCRASGLDQSPDSRGRKLVARLLHVDPDVTPGDRIRVGDDLGSLVTSGYFAPWVADHVHLDLRPADSHLRRASGSVPLVPDVSVTPLEWDGTGRVQETGETYVTLDGPDHPNPGTRWTAVGGVVTDGAAVPLDGGLPHYEGGGVFGREPKREEASPVTLLGTPVADAGGRRLAWREVVVRLNGRPATGLSLFASRVDAGVKVVARDHDLSVGDRARVTVAPGERTVLRPPGT